MSKSWQFLIILALLTMGGYVGYEIFNSITGQNTTFRATITPIQTDLGLDTLDHINQTKDELGYKGELSE